MYHYIAKLKAVCVVFQFQASENDHNYMVLHGGNTKKAHFLEFRSVSQETQD